MRAPVLSRGFRRTFRGGVHPPDRKELAREEPIRVLPTPDLVRIPLLQHLGAPCQAVVKPRDQVDRGDPVGKAGGFVSAPVHASIRGKVGRFTAVTLPNGRRVPAVPIKAEEREEAERSLLEETFGGEWPYLEGKGGPEPGAIVEAALEGGLVGLGGAAFPTHVKLRPPKGKKIDTLVVNGCECEPYLASDHRLMVEYPRPIWSGALLAARAVGAERIVLGLEDNKPEAFRSLEGALPPSKAEIVLLRTRYPQGGERQLIQAALGRVVPTGGLPLDVGVVVLNVGTAAALARAFYRGAPLTHRIVTVTGGGIARPGNLLAPVGAPFRDLIEACGGLLPEAERIVAGGPMMGFTVGDLDTPVTKGTSGITVLAAEETVRGKRTECVRCGRCVEVCPLRLVPTRLALAARRRNWEVARRFHIQACVECGSCAYGCPARIPLTQLIRMGKAMIPR